MTIYPEALDGEVLWDINPTLRHETVIEQFMQLVRDAEGEVVDTYLDVWRWSVDNPNKFWSLWADFAGVKMGGKLGVTRTPDPMPRTRWFPGRTLNYAEHLLAGHEGTAIIELDEAGKRCEITFSELRRRVAALAAHLRESGVVAGDRIVGILPNVSEAVVGILATASLGAIWSICAPEFGPGAITSRFRQLSPKVLIASPGYRQGGKDRNVAAEITAIVTSLDSLSHVIWVTEHTDAVPESLNIPGTAWSQIMERSESLHVEAMDFNHPLWVLFSSGTTGVPKGIVHSHGGALLEELKLAAIHNDVRRGDRVLIVASTSWVVWNGLVACLGLGATIVLVDGSPNFPASDRIWKAVGDERVNVLGLSAAFIHACMKGDAHPKDAYNMSCLRVVTSTGSPLSPDGFRWIYENVGDVWLTSQSGGTDIASIFIGGVPTLPVRAGFLQAPALGVRVESWSDEGKQTEGRGELVVTEPLPSMPLYFWGDDDGSRFHESYFDVFPGVWRHGDFVEFTESGVVIHGRSDSTLNRNGLRLGTADLYAVVDALPSVEEALVVGVERGTDYYMPLFVKKMPEANESDVRREIELAIRDGLSARYLPDEIFFVSGIPHTKTGKKLEVPIKRLFQGTTVDQVVDVGAVDNALLLDEFSQLAASRQGALS